MTTTIATRDGEVVLSSTEVELVRKTVASGATDDELRLFLHDCRRQGIHPLDKLIHFTKRGGRYTPITSIDFMRMRAADTGELAGNDDPTYVFKDGETVIPISASVTVWRLTQGQRFGYTATARWQEYKPPSGQDMMWLKMPQLMLGKCAEALALRKAFPKQLHGLYERAEMAQAGREDDLPRRTEASPRSSSHDGSTLAPTPARESRPLGSVEDERIDRPTAQDEAQVLLPTPAEAEERKHLLSEARRIIKARKLSPKAVNVVKELFLGSEDADVLTADVAALAAVVKHLRLNGRERVA